MSRSCTAAVVARGVALRMRTVDASVHLELMTMHEDTVSSLSLDSAESRFLISAAGDGTLALYDVEEKQSEKPTSSEPVAPLAFISRSHPCAHKHAATAAQWYPHDTGLFVSGGYDLSLIHISEPTRPY